MCLLIRFVYFVEKKDSSTKEEKFDLWKKREMKDVLTIYTKEEKLRKELTILV